MYPPLSTTRRAVLLRDKPGKTRPRNTSFFPRGPRSLPACQRPHRSAGERDGAHGRARPPVRGEKEQEAAAQIEIGGGHKWGLIEQLREQVAFNGFYWGLCLLPPRPPLLSGLSNVTGTGERKVLASVKSQNQTIRQRQRRGFGLLLTDY